jgi:hypothetical protein
MPVIDKLSSNTVSPKGSKLTITGMGFTKNTEVYASGYKATILS